MSLGNIEFHLPALPPEITPEHRRKAQMAVCAYASDAQEAAALMMMIGIHPGQDAEDADTCDQT